MTGLADPFDLAALDQALTGSRFAGKLHFFPSLASTNAYAMQKAESSAAEGSVYFADEQTAGRGRGAHAWSSPPGSGLYVSVLLRPQIPPADILWLSLAAGLAVQSAILEVSGIEADLRWPNDLLIHGKKVCGILTELNAEVTRVRHAVVGIGINVGQQQFPEELRPVATSLFLAAGHAIARQPLLLALLQSLDREVSALTASADIAAAAQSVRERLEANSSWVQGKRVRVDENGGFTGTTAGLDARGFLLVKTANGVRTVLSGGVREN
ncbi:MAG TPA: biotin--[acetyl-CoA-carboxylase] ligase [Acidobacteriaceae bacterium]|jgi:BirA family biotin operon repressor/biotin-[acetyl-CoA-carboxylase] ligase|nr:biotin--[acetyl-CoA-carboxylase] ligase [Acidobacteriaceae bacterium]